MNPLTDMYPFEIMLWTIYFAGIAVFLGLCLLMFRHLLKTEPTSVRNLATPVGMTVFAVVMALMAVVWPVSAIAIVTLFKGDKR